VIAYALPEDLSVLDRHWHPSEHQDFRDFLDKGVVGYGAPGPTPGEEAKTVTVRIQNSLGLAIPKGLAFVVEELRVRCAKQGDESARLVSQFLIVSQSVS
jgi:hypothetical protein